MPTITGTASDAGSGIAKVELRLHRVVNSVVQFWNGSAWGTTQVKFLATLNPATGGANVSWSKGNGWPTGGNLTDGTYYLTAYATDKAGKVATTASNFKKATVAGLSAAANQSLISSPSSDVILTSAEAWASNGSVRLTFSGDLNSTSAQNVAHYNVQVNTEPATGQAILVRSASYDRATRTVTLLLDPGSLHLGDALQVSWKLLDSSGAPVVGATIVQPQ